MTEPDDARRHARASELFVQLLQLPPASREAVLFAAEPHDEAMRREVLSLLQHVQSTGPGAGAFEPGEPTPERIGPYRVLRALGRGGSGLVFLAEQTEPVRRLVAIKLIPAARHDPELAARAYLERRALERAEHPNVARILDAGALGNGTPFLVMDYVEGPDIAAYARRERLSVPEVVRLMLPVVDAVEHAHQRGVVHRDLKPGNVLVATVDGRPSPRVLDFGIAKPIVGLFDEDSPATLGLIGTPAYMAPEQTGLGQADTRTDVYALGALLYELLAGRPPIEHTQDLFALLQRIREQVPEPVGRARARSPDLAALPAQRALLSDLGAVLAKALEKDPERRYSSAAVLRADLERALTRQVIQARVPTIWYRCVRFVERNRVLSSAAGILLAGLVVGVTGLAIGLREARAQRERAEAQRDSEAGLSQFLIEDILLAGAPDRAGADATALELLRRASRSLEHRLEQSPLTAAAQHQALADAFAGLGELDEAEVHVRRALELRREVAGDSAPETVRSEIAAASLLALRDRFAEAEEPLRKSLARARLILGPDSIELYTVANDLGVVLLSLGRAEEARPLLEEALAGRERLQGPSDRLVLASLANLSQALHESGDTARALEIHQEALERAETVPDPPGWTLLALYNNYVALLQELGRDREASPYVERAVALATEKFGLDDPLTLALRANQAALESDLGDAGRAVELYQACLDDYERTQGASALGTLETRHGVWSAMRKSGRATEAADGFVELLRDVRAQLGEDHPLEAQTQASLAYCLLELGLPEEALPHAQRAVARLTALLGQDHVRTQNAQATLARASKASGTADRGR